MLVERCRERLIITEGVLSDEQKFNAKFLGKGKRLIQEP